MKVLIQKEEMGITMNRAGSMFAMGKGLMPQILKPVANMMKPPTAEKSAIIVGVVMGMMAAPA